MTTETVKKPRKHKKCHGITVETFSLETLLTGDGLAAYVWPHEGEWVKGGFVFHDDYADFEPLLVDAGTRSLLKQIHEKLNDDARAKMEEKLAKNRGIFGKVVEWAWSIAKYG